MSKPKNKFLTRKRIIIFAAIAALVIVIPSTLQKPSPSTPVQQEKLVEEKMVTVGNHEIKVKVARTKEEHTKGLSGTQSLGENEGMIFVFETRDVYPAIFWMKDMLIPLDMIWINDDKIVHVHKNVPAPTPGTPDQELTLYTPGEPIDYVLEVNAGFIDKNKLAIGTRVNLSELEK